MKYQLGYIKFPGTLSGFSLIELMIAMTLGVVLVLGVTTVVVNSSRSYGELTKTSRQLENGRYAIEVLNEDLRHAGFYGSFFPPLPDASLAALPDPCTTDLASINAALSLAVQGYDQSVAKPSCISGSVANNTDALVVRRVSTEITPVPSSLPPCPPPAGEPDDHCQATLYMQSNLKKGSVISGIGSIDLPENPQIREFQVHIYFIRPFSRAGDNIPTLCRWTLEQGVECLVEGIENLQIDYGIDDDLDGIPDRYTSTPGVADWGSVVTAQVNLLARNVEITAGKRPPEAPKSYWLGSTEIKIGSDGEENACGSGGECYFKRRVFSSLIRLTNVAGRRETGEMR